MSLGDRRIGKVAFSEQQNHAPEIPGRIADGADPILHLFYCARRPCASILRDPVGYIL
jgi:hypothetical protein